ncbi:hypothetical protein H0H87_003486 [Tephrocybe sp. NHM501043]|nr:hypothetical protein H0H87_003486 [Tephrocybe sp. NHM501043]
MTDFAQFPLDILLGVFQHLNWQDLLVIRQVSKNLDAASRIRSVWTSQYQRYELQKKFRPLLEEPLNSYTSKELETWVLRRLSADEAWASGEGLAQLRTLIIEDLDLDRPLLNPLYLVRGGRWLLVIVTKTASVRAYDLDQIDPAKHANVLIPPRESPRGEYQMVIDPSIPAMVKSPKALCILSLRALNAVITESTSEGGLVVIWRVTLQEHGATARLEAQLLNSFTLLAFVSYRFRVSLRGDLFARTLQIWDEDNRAVIAFIEQTIHLLPGNRIAAFSNVALYIFDIETDLSSELAPVTDDPIKAQSMLDLLFFGPNLDQSLWMFDEDASYAILPATEDRDNSSGLVIPHATNQQPILIELQGISMPPFREYKFSYIGFSKAAFDVNGSQKSFRLEGFDYTWDAQGNSATSRHWLPILDSVIEKLALMNTRAQNSGLNYGRIDIMDEESGRAISIVDKRVVIIDLSRAPARLVD